MLMLPVAVHVPARRIIQLRAAQVATIMIPPPPAPCRRATTSPCDRQRAVPMLPVAVHVPLAGSYSSALLKVTTGYRYPPATSTLPEGSNVAV